MTTKLSLPPDTSQILPVKLDPILPPDPPRFPTFSELVELDASTPIEMTRRGSTDLFDGFLGDVTPLLSDFQENPERYGEETHALLEQLMSGNTSIERLSATEKRLLSLATYDFFQSKPVKNREKQASKKQASAKPGRVYKAKTLNQLRRESNKSNKLGSERRRSVPETELPAYWWLT